MGEPETSGEEEYDVYRDSLVRYCGYANEVGESFRPLVKPMFVHGTYGISIAYCMADSYDKAMKAEENRRVRCGADALIWQGFASVAVPGFMINRIVAGVKFGFSRMKVPSMVAMWGPTVIGLSAIPFIIHPIDHLVHLGMDATIRPWMDVPEHYQKT